VGAQGRAVEQVALRAPHSGKPCDAACNLGRNVVATPGAAEEGGIQTRGTVGFTLHFDGAVV
jgi:hypothetical protein